MAESTIIFLLNKIVIFLLKEEVKLLRGVQKDVLNVRDELESMKAFIRFVDATEEGDDQHQVWVKQVRDVAYDTEDVLDEFMFRLAHHHGDGVYASLCTITRLIKNLKARHQIASDIKAITSRVDKISTRHHRYSSKINIAETGSSSSSGNGTCHRRGDALLLKEAELVGIDKPRTQLIQWLVEGESKVEVISVVGMGGLGKTTVVKKVYDDAEVIKHFQNRAWVNVSQSFKLEELLKDIIQQLFSEIKHPIPQEVETENSDTLRAIINKFLQERRYLLVLDDVWRINVWDAFKYAFPNGSRSSRVILTTRIEEVAKASSKDFQGNLDKLLKLKPLSPEESRTLFYRKTFYEDSCPPHLVDLSNSMLKRCEGLPLAIVTISGVLATKDNSIDQWEMVLRSLGVELEGSDRFNSMNKILSLSYYNLPYYLKSCFLYLSIFPEDHLIECMRLIRLWIAEGFVEESEGKTLEEVAERYLSELLNRSLIQVAGTTSDGRVKTCRVHDLLREIIIKKSRDQKFVAIVKENNIMLPEKVRRLSIRNTLLHRRQSKTISKLRSLLLFGEVDSRSNLSIATFLGGFKLLTVLDLKDASLQMFPVQIVKLFNLRYLSLRDTKVKTIPSSIGKLQNLETLDLKRTYVAELPVEILKLQRLRHLLAYRYEIESYPSFHSKHGFKVPVQIGNLQSLQKLCFVEANEGNSRIIMEGLGRLNQLKRLGILNLREEDGMTLCFSIQKLRNLRALSITSVKEDEIIDLKYLSSPPEFIQRLYLTGRLESLPQWIPSLHSLSRVFLKWSRLDTDPLESLEKLPNLVHLEFLQVYNGGTLCFKNGGFQKLKLLSLDKLDELQSLIVEKETMPNLEKLIIQRCELLKKVPSGIKHLIKLKVLEFFDMSDDLITTIHPDRQGEDYQLVAHIPEVYYTNWKDGGWDAYSLKGESSDRTSKSMRSRIPTWYIS